MSLVLNLDTKGNILRFLTYLSNESSQKLSNDISEKCIYEYFTEIRNS